MTIELTNADRAAIREAASPPTMGEWTYRMECEAIYRAGLAAGIERAAKCAEYPCADSVCAAAIRALLK